MDTFEQIDLATWERGEEYRLFAERLQTTFSMTKHIPAANTVTYLKEHGLKLVPALLWIVSDAFNRCENFRLALRGGVLGRWDIIHPIFPTLNADKNLTLHSLRYTENFESFYDAYRKEQEETKDTCRLFPYPMPENACMVSVFPFVHFEGSSMHFHDPTYYTPFFAIGKYDGEKKLPCMLAGNHAVADGWHVSEVFRIIGERLDRPAEWCDFYRTETKNKEI